MKKCTRNETKGRLGEKERKKSKGGVILALKHS